MRLAALSMQDKYKHIGPIYDFLSDFYSGKSIQNCKTAMLDPERVSSGDRVLIAGVGHGRDALRAAELGAEVTVVDLSETMLRKFQELLEKEAPHLSVNIVHDDIMNIEEYELYDMVVANFFLNVFYEPKMVEVLRQLISLGKPRSRIVVGDFIYPTGNILARFLKKTYWYIAITVFWVFTRNAFHEIYNYPQHMERLGLNIKEKKLFSLLNVDCYWSILAEKRD